jgi:fatty acid desaturase
MLMQRWRSRGFFEPSQSIVVVDALTISTLFGLSTQLVHRFPGLSGLAFGAACHQTMRMAHECGHRSGICDVAHMPSETTHDWVAWLLTDVGAGTDFRWWKSAHRCHHEYTMSGRDCQLKAGDLPPIWAMQSDHLSIPPLLAQEFWWIPSLLFAQKLNFWKMGYDRTWKSFDDTELAVDGDRRWRKAGLMVHLILHACVAWPLRRKPKSMIKWIVACLCVQGLVGLQFMMNHIPTGENIVTAKNDMQSQIVHTVDYSCLWPLEEYLHISLAFQIEHHLVPKMPSEHLSKIVPDVKWLCDRHGLPYQSRPFTSLLWDHTVQLGRVSRDLGVFWHLLGVVVNLGIGWIFVLVMCWAQNISILDCLKLNSDQGGSGDKVLVSSGEARGGSKYVEVEVDAPEEEEGNSNPIVELDPSTV